MKKYVKLTLCGLAVAVLMAGCAKKAAEPDPATSEAASTEAVKDRGVVSRLGTYKGVEVTKASVEVTDEELEQRIQSILTANPEYIEVTGRPAQNGDIVDIDYVGMKDGEAFEGGTSAGYKLELGSNTFIDGFEEGLVGANTGDELSLNLTFPENYGNPDLAGQAVVFDVTVNSIEEVKEAVLDNNFVQRMSDFNNVDEWKADTLADMEAEKETQAEEQLENDALLAAVNNSEYELNDAAVEEQYNNQLAYYDNQLAYYNSMMQAYGMDPMDYEAMFGKTEEQFKKDLRSDSELAIKQQLLAAAVAEKENLKVEDADREALAAQYGMSAEELASQFGEETVEETAMMYKVVGFIREHAVVK